MNKLAKIYPEIYKKVIFRSGSRKLKLNALENIDDVDLYTRFVDKDNKLLDEIKVWEYPSIPYFFSIVPIIKKLLNIQTRKKKVPIGEITNYYWTGEFLSKASEIAKRKLIKYSQ